MVQYEVKPDGSKIPLVQTIVRSEFTRDEILEALRAKYPWIPPNHGLRIEATGDETIAHQTKWNDDSLITKGARLLIEYTKLGPAVALLFLGMLFLGGCVTPNAAWVAGGDRTAEVGLLAPVLAGEPQLRLEASVERRESTDDRYVEGKVKKAKQPFANAGGRKNKRQGHYEQESDADILARLGLRYDMGDYWHVAAGLNEELGPWGRVGVSRPLTPYCAIGADLLEDRGEVVLFGLTWSR